MKSSPELMKPAILILVSSFIFTANETQGGSYIDTDVEVLRSDISGITIRYIPAEASFTPVVAGGKEYSTLEIPRTAQNGRDGEVEIPIKIIPVALPPGARPRIEIMGAEYEEVSYRKLAPFFSRATEEEYERAFYSAEADVPRIPGTAPHIINMDNVRGLDVARLGVPTAQYSLTPPVLALLREITVRIEFQAGAEKTAAGYGNPGPVFDRIFRKSVVNYDIGRDWFQPRPASTLEAVSVFDSASTWIRIELTSDGIYGFGWSHFNIAGVNPLDIDPGRIRIFYGGGRELPVPNSQPRPLMLEIPIKVMGGSDGSFDNGDLVVFYADAVDSWDYSAQFQRYLYVRDHYTEKNVYWLTVDGSFSSPPRRLSSFDGAPDGAVDISVDTYRAWAHREQEREFRFAAGIIPNYYDWYWGYGPRFSTSVQLNDIVSGQEATIIARHQSGSPTLTINGGSPLTGTTYQTFTTYNSNQFANGTNNLELNSISDFFLDYIDIGYERWLRVIDETLPFSQPDSFGTIRYTLTDVISPYALFDIADRRNPVEITGGNLSGGTLTFDDTVSEFSHKRYYISGLSRFKSPGAVTRYEMDDLRDVALPENRADEIIITYDGFREQALNFAQHREQNYGIRTRVVATSEIYNQFSSGLLDPTAIRDFLKFAFENWAEPAPTFAFFIGDGNYDFRNNQGNNVRNYVPPFENTSWMTDEHFIYFGNEGYLDTDTNFIPDMVIGRLNARSAQEVDDFLAKTIDYDLSHDLGTWRHRIVIVADDNLKGNNVSETFHTSQAEVLANRHTPAKFDPVKIYLIEYPMEAGLEKPKAREAVVSAFNQGALIVNYIGHGSANLWADERIFRRIQDIPRLTNGKKMSLVFTASCSIGKYDIPSVECMAEELIRGGTNGTISVISATRDVYAQQNARLNELLFDQLLVRDSAGIGESLYMAKLVNSNGNRTDDNDRLYMVFGDPAQLLQFPKYDVNMTLAPDSLVALTVDSVSGEVVNDLGAIQSDFNGTVWVTVKDGNTNRSITLRDQINNPLPPPNTITFLSPGPSIFIGPADVRNGQFTSRFFIPKDVSYGSRGARIYAYAENGAFDALGEKDSILVSGSLPSLQDSAGPAILLVADGRTFSAGRTMVPSNFTLGAEISDEHGINITGQLGHSIVVSIDDGEVFEGDVTGYFRFNQGDYRGGRLEYRMPELPLGEHTISVKAWDNFNNSSMVTSGIEVVATNKLEITDVMNYPNPVRASDNGTSFQYCLNNDVDRVTIKIFTEAGRKIKTIELTSDEMTQMDCNQTPWNLLDADGDQLANGIYIYQVRAQRQNGAGAKEEADETGKLVILR
jgi:hypothetical protein